MTRGFVRIIGGDWRGRKIKVPEVPNLRPTPDRVRETLFNWLAPMIVDAYCLDAFAGTGVLSFEAISRGAAYAVMLDQSHEVIKNLQEMADLLGPDKILICRAKMPHKLDFLPRKFNIVFLDPPYQSDLLLPTCFNLEEQGILADTAYIYLEAQREIQDNELPEHWQIIKYQRAGQVFYHLAKRAK